MNCSQSFYENSFRKMIDNYLKNTLKTSKKLPEAFPAYPEIANKTVCHEKRQLLIRKLRFTLNCSDAAKRMKSLYKCSKKMSLLHPCIS